MGQGHCQKETPSLAGVLCSLTMRARKSGPLTGTVRVPGDKSISHRALIFGALAEGVTRISGLLEGDDVLRTAAALRAMGIGIEKDGGTWVVTGGQWRSPEPAGRRLYAGNAGTGARLLMGAVAGQGIAAGFDGDASLRARPMGRVLDPLAQMGVVAEAKEGKLPVDLAAGPLRGIRYRLPKPSAQVKSALLLAGLGAVGETVIEEPVLCRDHTERMLTAFGVRLDIQPLAGGGREIRLAGGQRLKASEVEVPGDPSSAAFPVVAALITPGSDIRVENVLMNPQRTGLFETLREMGGAIEIVEQSESGGEELATLRVRHSALKGIEVDPARAPSMIDEYPVLSIAAAVAEGETFMPGLEELRVKESDRLAAVEAGLKVNCVTCEAGPDWLRVRGGAAPGGGVVETHLDHRIAMSFLVLGLVADQPVEIDSGEMIATSFPTFADLMTGLGAALA